MDFSTTIYDSTAQDNFFSLPQPGPVLSPYQVSTFIGQLLSTIDVTTLGSVYYHQLMQYLPLTGVNVADIRHELCFGDLHALSKQENMVSLPVCHLNNLQQVQQVHYVFSRKISRRERTALAELHRFFCQQLSHALEFDRLQKMATKDPLTGLGNRNGFNEACARLISRCNRHHEQFALLIIDLDNFKAVNDSQGHQEGDKVLVKVAEYINSILRDSDEAFRFGGDEFCCLLDCDDANKLIAVAQRLKDAIDNCDYLCKNKVSCSIGGTVYRYSDDIASLFDRADVALYRVKQSGKNAYQAA